MHIRSRGREERRMRGKEVEKKRQIIHAPLLVPTLDEPSLPGVTEDVQWSGQVTEH